MNPYLIAGPALISFSGGRTSAYMLHQILAAHDGKLPPDVHVAFSNTGKEREETLRFVKGRGIRKRLIRDGQSSPAWWIAQEREQGGRFDRRDTMADLVDECLRTPTFFDEPVDFEYDVECGLTCAPIDDITAP